MNTEIVNSHYTSQKERRRKSRERRVKVVSSASALAVSSSDLDWEIAIHGGGRGTTLHIRMGLKERRTTGTSDTRGEERVKGFGAVFDVLITGSGGNFKASEIVHFRNCSNFAAEVIVETIVFQSAVDSKHGRVWMQAAEWSRFV